MQACHHCAVYGGIHLILEMITFDSSQEEIPELYGGDSGIPVGEWELEKLIEDNLDGAVLRDERPLESPQVAIPEEGRQLPGGCYQTCDQRSHGDGASPLPWQARAETWAKRHEGGVDISL
jgi:hypothetical protein